MTPVTITLVITRNLMYPCNPENIRKWQSSIFRIVNIERLGSFPNCVQKPPGYSDNELAPLFNKSDRTDITVAIVGVQLEENFYARILNTGVVVLSLYEMADILKAENHDVETFVVRCLYASVLIFLECGREIRFESARQLHHNETRGCLYDLNQDKVDIVRSLDRPKLCGECLARLERTQVDAAFEPALVRELKRIRKGKYYRILDWAKRNPIKVLIFTTLWAAFINIATNFAYDYFKAKFSKPATIPTLNSNEQSSPNSTGGNHGH